MYAIFEEFFLSLSLCVHSQFFLSFRVIKFSGQSEIHKFYGAALLLRNGTVFNHRTRAWKRSKFPCGMVVARGVEWLSLETPADIVERKWWGKRTTTGTNLKTILHADNATRQGEMKDVCKFKLRLERWKILCIPERAAWTRFLRGSLCLY